MVMENTNMLMGLIMKGYGVMISSMGWGWRHGRMVVDMKEYLIRARNMVRDCTCGQIRVSMKGNGRIM